MYVFVCGNGHKSYSSSKDGFNQTCPTCGESTVLVSDESQDKPTRPQS